MMKPRVIVIFAVLLTLVLSSQSVWLLPAQGQALTEEDAAEATEEAEEAAEEVAEDAAEATEEAEEAAAEAAEDATEEAEEAAEDAAEATEEAEEAAEEAAATNLPATSTTVPATATSTTVPATATATATVPSTATATATSTTVPATATATATATTRTSGLIIDKYVSQADFDGPPPGGFPPPQSANGFGFTAVEVDGTCDNPVPGGDVLTAVEIDTTPDQEPYSTYQFVAGTANGLKLSTYYCIYETDTVNEQGRTYEPVNPAWTTGAFIYTGPPGPPGTGYTSEYTVVNCSNDPQAGESSCAEIRNRTALSINRS